MDHKRRRTDHGGPPHLQYNRGGYSDSGPGGNMNDTGGMGSGYGGDGYGMNSNFGGQGMPSGFQQGGGGMGTYVGGMMGGPGQGMGMGMGMGMGSFERIFPCVKLRGLPFDVTEDDIRVFLGNEPLDVVLARRGGRVTGEAFAVFTNPMQVEHSLRKDKTYLGRRYVEVFKAKKWDYYRAVASVIAEFGEGGGRGGYQGGHGGGHGGGERYHHAGGGGDQGGHGRFEAGRFEGGGHHGRDNGHHSGGGSGRQQRNVDTSDGVLKLRGLPFNATVQDVLEFFDDGSINLKHKVSAADVHMVIDTDGRPSGHAFVAFGSQQDADAAMTKNKQMIGTRYIEIFAASREEAAKAAQRRMGGRN